MVAVDYKAALGNPTSIDHANIEIQGMRVSKTIKLGLFTTNQNAVEAGDYYLSKESYPIARVRLVVNRNLFRLQPGDPFVLKLPKYGITEMVCRVVTLEEENVESEKITVNAVEESIHATQPITTYTEPDSYRKRRVVTTVGDVVNAKLIEVPYALRGEESMEVVFLVPMQTGDELGYSIYTSLDGEEYYFYKAGDVFSVYGTLDSAYPKTSAIDDEVGVTVNFDSAQRTSLLQSISRTELYGYRNLAVIDDEIVTFQTVTPITSSQFKLTGVYRGRWGTVMASHNASAPFYFVPSIVPYSSPNFVVGTTIYYKITCYSRDSSFALGSATEYSHTFEGESYKPYEVINLKANDQYYNPRYNEENIVLTWTPRVRGTGTGIGTPETVVDSAMTHEGHFRVNVLVNGSTVRSVEDLDVYTWTYTTAMNLSDNTTYPDTINFEVENYIIGNNSVEYCSDPTTIRVRSVYTSTSTTTTSTTTTSTTTSSSTTTTT